MICGQSVRFKIGQDARHRGRIETHEIRLNVECVLMAAGQSDEIVRHIFCKQALHAASERAHIHDDKRIIHETQSRGVNERFCGLHDEQSVIAEIALQIVGQQMAFVVIR